MKTPFKYFFGYGSLMYPDGINGRGMQHEYTWNDLLPATINNLQRGMFAKYMNTLYYGLVSKAGSKVNGVIFPIYSVNDLDVLLMDEGAHLYCDSTKRGRMYNVIGTSDYTCDKLSDYPLIVMTLINLSKPDGGKVFPWYMAHVWRGIQPWGKEFCNEFLLTGGVKPSVIADKMVSIYSVTKKIGTLIRN